VSAWVAIPFVVLVLLGMLWSDAPAYERLHQLSEVAKFLVLPLLIYHFERSPRGMMVLRAAIGEHAMVVSDPHNQTLNVAVQWGLIGIVLLWAMWLVHLLLFRGEGLVAWIGLLVVVQNMPSSLINSHLFDFTEGWIYVLGVGIAAGMTLAQGVNLQSPAPAGSASESRSRGGPHGGHAR